MLISLSLISHESSQKMAFPFDNNPTTQSKKRYMVINVLVLQESCFHRNYWGQKEYLRNK
jgi:hypothetical protein